MVSFKSFDAVCPPVPLISTGAQDIFNGLHIHRQNQPLEWFEKQLYECSNEYWSFRGGDNAVSNDRAGTYACEQLPDDIHQDKSVCINHKNQICEASCMTQCGTFQNHSYEVLNTIYAVSLFLHTGGHFHRLLLATRKWCGTQFRVVSGEPPPEHAAWTSILLTLYSRTNDRSVKMIDAYHQKLLFFFRIFNGRVSDEPCHYTTRPVDPDMLARLQGSCDVGFTQTN